MKQKKIEQNIIIAIHAMKKIMTIFLGPFLTAYFIKTSQESVLDLSIYYIFSYLLLGIGSFVVASIVKRHFRLGMFRIGVILNFLYIIAIIVLKEKILQHLGLIAILYGVSSSTYYFPYNLVLINKIDNKERIQYSVKSKIITSIIGIVCPILLGSMITITNYELTAVIILVISICQIIASFLLSKDEKGHTFMPFHLKQTWHTLKENKQIRKMSLVEFFIGMNVSDGALEILMTILIFQSFKTNLNLGIITSITTILSMLVVHTYGKRYRNKQDKRVIMMASILPVLAVFVLLVWRNNVTIILYNICYVIFTSLLQMIRDIRLLNLSDSRIVDKENQCEFFAIREGILNIGRVVSYGILLLAGMSGSSLVLNMVMVVLTLSILIMGWNMKEIERFEK